MIAPRKNKIKLHSFMHIIFFIGLLSTVKYSWGMQALNALVITMEPLIAQIKKREYNQEPFKEIDRFVISRALQNNTNLVCHIKRHSFVRDDLSWGRRSYRGTKVCPYVIEMVMPFQDQSLLAQYIAGAIQANNVASLQTSYTTCEIVESGIAIRSQFDNRKRLLQFIEDLKKG